jgi:hypothetical protein
VSADLLAWVVKVRVRRGAIPQREPETVGLAAYRDEEGGESKGRPDDSSEEGAESRDYDDADGDG